MATLKRAKLDRFRFHALRHFFVTALFRGGVSAPVVQKLALAVERRGTTPPSDKTFGGRN